MSALGVVGKIASPLLGVLGVFDKPKPRPTAMPLPVATPRSNSSVLADELTRRRGSADNRRTGAGGAESTTTGKKSLMGQ